MKRHAVTLVELLTVFAIVTLLAAMLLVGLQAARESARRMACSNNLRQIGLAIHSFESRTNEFPTGDFVKIEKATRNGKYYAAVSPHFQLLPDLDQIVLATIPVFPQLSGGHPPLVLPLVGSHYTTQISTFQCPSEPPGIGTNYRFSTGRDAFADYHPELSEGATGVLKMGSILRANSFAQGWSNTIGVSERLRSTSHTGFDLRRDIWFAALVQPCVPPYFPPTAVYLEASRSALMYEPASVDHSAGHTWLLASYCYTAYNHVLVPNSEMISLVGGARYERLLQDGGIVAATSSHFGGVNSLRVDGGASFISNSIDGDLWQQLSVVESSE